MCYKFTANFRILKMRFLEPLFSMDSICFVREIRFCFSVKPTPFFFPLSFYNEKFVIFAAVNFSVWRH